MSLIRVEITRKVWEHLEGSGLWQHVGDRPNYSSVPHEQAAAESFVSKVNSARPRKDGSMRVDLTAWEVEVLRGQVGMMEIGGRDNAWTPEGRGDLAAARALLRKIGRRAY